MSLEPDNNKSPVIFKRILVCPQDCSEEKKTVIYTKISFKEIYSSETKRNLKKEILILKESFTRNKFY